MPESNQREQWPEDDEVVITDLDAEHAQPRFLRAVRQARRHLSTQQRALRFGLAALLILLVVLAVHEARSQPQAVPTARQVPQPVLSPNFSVQTDTARGIVYIAQKNGVVAAYRAGDGKPLWQRRLMPAALPFMAVGSQAIYCYSNSASDGEVTALRSSDGVILWRERMSQPGPHPLSVIGDTVFVNTHSGLAWGMIYALRASDGIMLWHFYTGLEMPLDALLLAYGDGVVAIQGVPQEVYFLRIRDGASFHLQLHIL